MAQWGSGFTAWTKSGNFIASRMKKTGVLLPTGQNPFVSVKLGSEAANIADGVRRPRAALHGGKAYKHRGDFIG